MRFPRRVVCVVTVDEAIRLFRVRAAYRAGLYTDVVEEFTPRQWRLLRFARWRAGTGKLTEHPS